MVGIGAIGIEGQSSGGEAANPAASAAAFICFAPPFSSAGQSDALDAANLGSSPAKQHADGSSSSCWDYIVTHPHTLVIGHHIPYILSLRFWSTESFIFVNFPIDGCRHHS